MARAPPHLADAFTGILLGPPGACSPPKRGRVTALRCRVSERSVSTSDAAMNRPIAWTRSPRRRRPTRWRRFRPCRDRSMGRREGSPDASTDPYSKRCRTTTVFSEQLSDVCSPALVRVGRLDRNVERSPCARRAGWPWRLPARAPTDTYMLILEHTVLQPTDSPSPKGPRSCSPECRGHA